MKLFARDASLLIYCCLGSPSWELSSGSFLANISKAILPYSFSGSDNVSPFFFLASVCDHLFSGKDSSLSQYISWHFFRSP